jgi:hypothetical protein
MSASLPSSSSDFQTNEHHPSSHAEKPFVITITAPHACCRDLCFDRQEELQAHACDFMAQRAARNLYMQLMQVQSKHAHSGDIFIMKHINDTIPRRHVDLNRYGGRFTEWRTELHGKIKQSDLVLDIHSFPADTTSYGQDVSKDDVVFLVYGLERNMRWVQRWQTYLHENNVQCRILHASQTNDILLVAEASNKHAVIIEYNESLTPERLHDVNTLCASFVVKNFID